MRKSYHRTVRLVRYVFYKETIVIPSEMLRSFIGAFLGTAAITFFHNTTQDYIFLVGSFGASAVLLYGSPNSPMAQPRNLLLGHVISAMIGVCFYKLIPDMLWLSSGLSVATSIVAMQMTKSMHPPGGATALIANIGSEKIKQLGFLYVFFPVFSGAIVLLVFALVVGYKNYPTKKR